MIGLNAAIHGFFVTFGEALPGLRVCLKSEDFTQC